MSEQTLGMDIGVLAL